MTAPTTPSHLFFFASCPRNTEGLLLDELRALNVTNPKETRSGVYFEGGLHTGYEACLWSRVASRVLMRLASVPADSVDDLYELAAAIPWEDHVEAEGTIAVEATSAVSRGPLAQVNTHFVEQRVKDAVVDRFRRVIGTRPGVDRARPQIRINLHLSPAEAIVSLDLSGEGLHRRGYRLEGGEAPLRENLAAAILMRVGWPDLARHGYPLLDPMCGSGTLLIEGVLMAGDVAPGLSREYFGFLGWKGHNADLWQELRQEAESRRQKGLTQLPPAFGFDADSRAIGTARANARRAGLAGRVYLELRPLADLVPLPGAPTKGLAVTNPPYGKRLGEVSELVGLYETLGERLKASFPGWTAAIFSGNPELLPHLGMRAHRANVFFNGPIESKLLQFHIGRPRTGRRPRDREDGPLGASGSQRLASSPDDSSSTASDIHGAAPPRPEPSPGARMFSNRLVKNHKHLRRWAAREGVHCYRLYDADLPEYAAAIDLYEDWVLIQEYAPPSSVDPVRARRRLKEMLTMAPEALGLPQEHAVLKVRRPQRGTHQYERLDRTGSELHVQEGGLRFLVNLRDYLDTGLFLDHRPTRALIRELAPGRRFLNLFCYTATATVYAAAGGANTTTSVDLSSTYLNWARRNLELNGLLDDRHRFVRADCLEWLATEHQERYDLIFLDAPTFSNSKSMAQTLDIQRDHAVLIRSAARLLSPDGTLLFSTNFRRFKLDPQLTTDPRVEDITKQTVPPDFGRNPRIHSCYRISAGNRLDRSARKR